MKKRRMSLVLVIMLVAMLSASAGCSAADTQQMERLSQLDTDVVETVNGDVEQTVETEHAADEEDTQSNGTMTYTVNNTGQIKCYNNQSEISAPAEGDDFYGQDAQYAGNEMSFTDNGDGTVTDNVTGLMWMHSPLDEKLTWDEAMAVAQDFELAGYDDWRLPSIKEMYSLIDFNGEDVSTLTTDATSGQKPFINTDYFDFEYGDTDAGERIIDVQYASSTKYVSPQDGELTFGVNMADGRIKGYGLTAPNGSEKTFVVMFVRGNEAYGENNFVDNGDGTITDLATGLMWMKQDSGEGMEWQDALEWSESLEYAGYADWRLPDAKELQSIVDYSRSPDTTNTAAIDPMFECTVIEDEGGNDNYAFYWTSTTHASTRGGSAAVYIAFGEALGFMDSSGQGENNAASGLGQTNNGQMPQRPLNINDGQSPPSTEDAGIAQSRLVDVHGAGAQRSDPKTGDASDYPQGHGPQGDVVRIDNYVRCVRSVEVEL